MCLPKLLQEKQELLKQWVLWGENLQAVETTLKVSRSQQGNLTRGRELLTIRERKEKKFSQHLTAQLLTMFSFVCFWISVGSLPLAVEIILPPIFYVACMYVYTQKKQATKQTYKHTYTYTYTYTETCTYTYTCIHTHTYIQTYRHTDIQT